MIQKFEKLKLYIIHYCSYRKTQKSQLSLKSLQSQKTNNKTLKITISKQWNNPRAYLFT